MHDSEALAEGRDAPQDQSGQDEVATRAAAFISRYITNGFHSHPRFAGSCRPWMVTTLDSYVPEDITLTCVLSTLKLVYTCRFRTYSLISSTVCDGTDLPSEWPHIWIYVGGNFTLHERGLAIVHLEFSNGLAQFKYITRSPDNHALHPCRRKEAIHYPF